MALEPENSQYRETLVAALLEDGANLLTAGDAEHAAKQFEAATAIDANSALAHNRLGTAYARLGQADQARRHLQIAMNLEPGNPAFAKNLADLPTANASKSR